MDLPNYFLADLPPDAPLSGTMVADACQALKRNRELYLRDRSTESLVRTVSELAASWLEPDYSFRKRALAADPRITGFSAATLTSGLDAFFRQLTADNLRELLTEELGHHRRLDEFVAISTQQQRERAALARGPEFLVYEVEPKLGACLEIAEWRGGQDELESALYREADCVTATGTDETLAAVRQKVPVQVRFLGYGHRVSFGYVTREVLSGFNVAKVVARAARDVAAWNQQGCLSPHLFYVERGGRVSDEAFAQLLAEQLARHEEAEPRGAIPEAEAAAIAARRAFYEVRAAHSGQTRQWASSQSTAWTVVFESDARFQISCLNRFVYVKPVADVSEALQAADPVRGRVSTVGLAATEDQAPSLASTLGRWGVNRICPLGDMQNSPLLWRHDGRPSLGDLVTWTDWELSP